MTADKSRRLFLRHSVAAVIALPAVVMAQPKARMRRVALLLSSNPAGASHVVKALLDGLAELGWVEGRNLRLEIRYAEGDASRYRPLAAELLGLKPDVVAVAINHAAQEAAALTKTVPIVFILGSNPVERGLVQSLAKPGGNVTGLSTLTIELMSKRLALLKEAVPGLKRVAVMYATGFPVADPIVKSLAGPARTLGVAILSSEIPDADGIDRAFEQVSQQKADGIMPLPDGFMYQHRARVMDLAIKHRLACAVNAIEFARAGALFIYGANFVAMYRRSATLIDKILKGANPATIPVEQASVFDLVVNLKTARALGIKLPRSFLLQATETIE